MVREWPCSLDSVPIINKLTRECLGCRQGTGGGAWQLQKMQGEK